MRMYLFRKQKGPFEATLLPGLLHTYHVDGIYQALGGHLLHRGGRCKKSKLMLV